MAATVGLVAIAFGAPHLTPAELAWAFCVIALFMGTVMGVVQVTVQAVSGPRLLGTAEVFEELIPTPDRLEQPGRAFQVEGHLGQ